jgi:septum formation protein
VSAEVVSLKAMLVLASASPRRKELLRNAGIQFMVQPADVDESTVAGESARDCAERLAREKALAVSRRRPRDFVLGADTVVTIDDLILGKPRDKDEAAGMLRILSGRKHEVITGVCLVRPGSERANVRSCSESTQVMMSEISEDEIREYVAGGESMDKAGAYAIQGMAARWIPRIEGDYNNVVGLPIALVYSMLKAAGIKPEG